jgi:hypothetical protein
VDVDISMGQMDRVAINDTSRLPHIPSDIPHLRPIKSILRFAIASLTLSQPGHLTMTGSFTVTRPLITQTVTQCNKW